MVGTYDFGVLERLVVILSVSRTKRNTQSAKVGIVHIAFELQTLTVKMSTHRSV